MTDWLAIWPARPQEGTRLLQRVTDIPLRPKTFAGPETPSSALWRTRTCLTSQNRLLLSFFFIRARRFDVENKKKVETQTRINRFSVVEINANAAHARLQFAAVAAPDRNSHDQRQRLKGGHGDVDVLIGNFRAASPPMRPAIVVPTPSTQKSTASARITCRAIKVDLGSRSIIQSCNLLRPIERQKGKQGAVCLLCIHFTCCNFIVRVNY